MTVVVAAGGRGVSCGPRADAAETARVGAVLEIGRSALEHWRREVRSVLATRSSGGAGAALRELAEWYERMCVDDRYARPAPEDGVDALVAMRTDPDSMSSGTVMVADWAVRVARELACCRAQQRSDPPDVRAGALALAKLDVALYGAFERLSGR